MLAGMTIANPEVHENQDASGESKYKREPLGLINEKELPWGNISPLIRFREAETSEAILKYQANKEHVFGFEMPGTYAIDEGTIDQDAITRLIHSSLDMFHEEKIREHTNVFENVSIANANVIFEDAAKALEGDKTYNRMLWTAMGLLVKEHFEEMPHYLMRKKIEMYTDIDIGSEGVWISGYPDKEARAKQLQQLERNMAENAQRIRNWLEENYPIPAEEKTIKTPFEQA